MPGSDPSDWGDWGPTEGDYEMAELERRGREQLIAQRKREAQQRRHAVRSVKQAHKAADYAQDSDCDVDPDTWCCRVCGVDHSCKCVECEGRGFHKPGCSLSDASYEEETA